MTHKYVVYVLALVCAALVVYGAMKFCGTMREAVSKRDMKLKEDIGLGYTQ
jgi:hypothetical protein